MTKTVLVTGASSGFGEALARRLAASGYQVYGTSRSTREPSHGVTMLSLDVGSDASVESCVRLALERAGHIDILVNNAGYLHEGALEELSIAELTAIFDTNFVGAVRMIKAVLPSMRERRSGRIVNVGSLAGLMPLPFWGAYCASKHALESYSESLRFELAPLGIAVSVVEPGFYKTALAASARRTSPPDSPYNPWRDRMFARAALEAERAPDSTPVVDLLMRVIESPRPRLRYPIGKFRFDYFLRGLTPERLWELGVRLTWGLETK